MNYVETVQRNQWIPHRPHPRQQTALLCDGAKELLFGGAAGGGKSDLLLMAALQYVHVPGYAALLLRRTFRDLNQPDALIPRSKEWLLTKADWSQQDKRWTFPSGATITFGYLEHADDVYQYQGAAFQFVGFDELTQFHEFQYLYLFSRLRRPAGMSVPLRMRAASNPGGVGHEWVRRRFMPRDGILPTDRMFIPSKLSDNPSLDQAAYMRGLMELDPVTRAQLLDGVWDAVEGNRFRRQWFRRWRETPDRYFLDGGDEKGVPKAVCWYITICDPAASVKESADFTAIITLCVTPDRHILVVDMVRERMGVEAICSRIAHVCQRWQPQWVGIETQGFQVAIYNEACRRPDIPSVRGLEPAGKDKLVRATPAINRCESGRLFFPTAAPWLDDFELELLLFTGDKDQDAHDDQVDALAYGVQEIDRAGIIGKVEQPTNGRLRDLTPRGVPGRRR